MLLSIADAGGSHLFIVVSILVSLALIPISLSSRPPFQSAEPVPLKELLKITPIGLLGCIIAGTLTGALLGSTTGSSASQGLDAISAAFDEPLASGANRAFYRQGAVLNVIVVSDRDDRSAVAPQALIERLGARYGGTNLASISAVVGTQPSGCTSAHGEATYAPRYIEAAQQSGGIVQSICAPAWARAFEFSGAPFGPRPRFYLTHPPVTETLRVFVDGTEVPPTTDDGAPQWSYDYATNTINFVPSAVPEPGARIRVTYSAECL